MYIQITKSNIKGKKFTAMFYDANKQLIKTTHFGASGYPDYTVPPHDEERRKRYISRHKSNESWNDPMSAGALSRYILWEYPSLSTAFHQYAKRFRLKQY